MPVPITALYAALLAVLATVLSFQVGGARLRSGVSILHGDDMDLAERIRRHANFIEAVPLALILLGLIELNGAPPLLVHALGLALLAARIVHPFGIRHDRMRHPARFVGALGTVVVTLLCAAVALFQFVTA